MVAWNIINQFYVAFTGIPVKMTITPIENLKDFAHNRPPVMVFMACLGFFAIILMSLAYYVKLTDDIPDPDIRQVCMHIISRVNTFMLEHCKPNYCFIKWYRSIILFLMWESYGDSAFCVTLLNGLPEEIRKSLCLCLGLLFLLNKCWHLLAFTYL